MAIELRSGAIMRGPHPNGVTSAGLKRNISSNTLRDGNIVACESSFASVVSISMVIRGQIMVCATGFMEHEASSEHFHWSI